MTVIEEVKQALTDTPIFVARNLRTLKRLSDKNDREIAEGMGKPKHWVQERMSGKRPCDAGTVKAFALYFKVPVAVMYEPPAALMRVLVEQGFDPSRWMDDIAGGWGSARTG